MPNDLREKFDRLVRDYGMARAAIVHSPGSTAELRAHEAYVAVITAYRTAIAPPAVAPPSPAPAAVEDDDAGCLFDEDYPHPAESTAAVQIELNEDGNVVGLKERVYPKEPWPIDPANGRRICSLANPRPKDAPGQWAHQDYTSRESSDGGSDYYTCRACGATWADHYDDA